MQVCRARGSLSISASFTYIDGGHFSAARTRLVGCDRVLWHQLCRPSERAVRGRMVPDRVHHRGLPALALTAGTLLYMAGGMVPDRVHHRGLPALAQARRGGLRRVHPRPQFTYMTCTYNM